MVHERSASRPIYVFLHIPKCAGSTFRFHVNRNLKPEERLNINSDIAFRRIGDEHRFYEVGWNPDYDAFLQRELDLLDSQAKTQIKVIQGHGVFYGIHKYFERECRYITFLREPVSRTVSEYNYLRMLLDQPAKDELMREIIDGRIERSPGVAMDFPTWLSERYSATYQMAGFLHARKFLDTAPSEATPKDLQRCLDRFYFVGLTESFDTDSLFFYDELGIRKFYKDQNRSKRYFRPDTRQAGEIASKNSQDVELYDLAGERNRVFKHENAGYQEAVIRIHRRRKLMIPLTSFLMGSQRTLGQLKRIVKRKR